MNIKRILIPDFSNTYKINTQSTPSEYWILTKDYFIKEISHHFKAVKTVENSENLIIFEITNKYFKYQIKIEPTRNIGIIKSSENLAIYVRSEGELLNAEKYNKRMSYIKLVIKSLTIACGILICIQIYENLLLPVAEDDLLETRRKNRYIGAMAVIMFAANFVGNRIFKTVDNFFGKNFIKKVENDHIYPEFIKLNENFEEVIEKYFES